MGGLPCYPVYMQVLPACLKTLKKIKYYKTATVCDLPIGQQGGMYVLGSKLVRYLHQNAEMWTSFTNEDVTVSNNLFHRIIINRCGSSKNVRFL